MDVVPYRLHFLVGLIPFRVEKVFMWFLKVPALALPAALRVVHGSTVNFSITRHAFHYG